jgi:phosphoribosylaminoimidazolecarboxamide formyltransferase/IMP cyclohydrolase
MLQHLVEIYNQNYFAIYNNNYIMNTTKTIQSALISVFSKEGLEPIVRKLHSQNVVLYSTGGTYKNLGIPVTAVEDVTSLHLGRKSKDIHKSFLEVS